MVRGLFQLVVAAVATVAFPSTKDSGARLITAPVEHNQNIRTLLDASEKLRHPIVSSEQHKPAAAMRDDVNPSRSSHIHGARIAVVFHGLPRAIDVTRPSIRAVLSHLKKRGHVETFFHTFSSFNSTNRTAVAEGDRGESLGADHMIVEDLSRIQSNLGLSKYRSQQDPWREYDVARGKGAWGSLDSAVTGLYSLAAATRFALAHGPFDVFVFMRPDMWYANPEAVALCLSKVRPGTAGLLSYGRFRIHGSHSTNVWLQKNSPHGRKPVADPINDRFAVMTASDAPVWGLRFDRFLNYSKVVRAHAETFAGDVLASAGIGVSFCEPLCVYRVKYLGGELKIPQADIDGAANHSCKRESVSSLLDSVRSE
jgi:hypothetical protein